MAGALHFRAVCIHTVLRKCNILQYFTFGFIQNLVLFNHSLALRAVLAPYQKNGSETHLHVKTIRGSKGRHEDEDGC